MTAASSLAEKSRTFGFEWVQAKGLRSEQLQGERRASGGRGEAGCKCGMRGKPPDPRRKERSFALLPFPPGSEDVDMCVVNPKFLLWLSPE